MLTPKEVALATEAINAVLWHDPAISASDQEDILQDVLTGLQCYPKAIDSIGAFARTMARNKRADLYRKRKRQERTLLEIAANLPARDAHGARCNEELQAIREAVSKVPQPYRDFLVLVFFEGLTLTEAANRLGICRKTATRHQSQGLEQLRRILQIGRAHV